MGNERVVSLLFRIGVAFAFLYPPISALLNPAAWVGYFPPSFLDLFSGQELFLLHSFGIFEVLIALWILSGKKIFVPSAVATLSLLAIVAFNFSQIDVVFRDLSIAAAAAALAVQNYPRIALATTFTTRLSRNLGRIT